MGIQSCLSDKYFDANIKQMTKALQQSSKLTNSSFPSHRHALRNRNNRINQAISKESDDPSSLISSPSTATEMDVIGEWERRCLLLLDYQLFVPSRLIPPIAEAIFSNNYAIDSIPFINHPWQQQQQQRYSSEEMISLEETALAIVFYLEQMC